MRVIQTPPSLAFVGRATFEGITGAPVLVEEFERDPPAAPIRASRRPTTTRSAISSWPRAATPSASRRRPRTRSPSWPPARPTTCSRAAYLACTAPGAGRAGDEQPHVRAPGDAGEPRGCCASAACTSSSPAPARSPRAASGESAGSPSRRRSSRRSRWSPGGAPRPLDGMRVLVTAGGTREPLDSVRFVGNRSSGRMGFALAAEAARRGRRRDRGRREHRARRARRASGTWTVETAERAARRDASAVRRRGPAADGGRGRRLPAREPRATTRSPRRAATRCRWSWSRPPTCCPRRRRSRREGQILVGFAAEHGPGGRRARPGEARAQDARRDRRERHLARPTSASTRTRTRSRSSAQAGELHVPRSTKEEVAARVLDFVQELRVSWNSRREREKPMSDQQIRPIRRAGCLRAVPARRSRCSTTATGRRPPSRSRRRSGSSRTRPRSARRSGAPTSAAAATAARPVSSRPSSSAIRPTTTPTSASAARSRSSATAAPPAATCRSPAGMRPDREDYRLYRDRLKAA